MTDQNLPVFWDERISKAIERKALSLSKSGIIPLALRNKPADIEVILQMAYELDIPPMQAINGINVIQGRPTVSPQLMIALIRRKIPNAYIKIEEHAGGCDCTMARGTTNLEIEQGHKAKWDMGKASKMGLASKDNYIKQPQTMLRWRAVGEAARMIFPDILMGLYFPDELEHNELTDEEGAIPVEFENMSALISSEDQKALGAHIKALGFTKDQVIHICLNKFRIGESAKLTKAQYKELIEILNTSHPNDIGDGTEV